MHSPGAWRGLPVSLSPIGPTFGKGGGALGGLDRFDVRDLQRVRLAAWLIGHRARDPDKLPVTRANGLWTVPMPPQAPDSLATWPRLEHG